MCDSIMKCKTRLLFLGIAISLLIGCLSKAFLFTSEDNEISFGPITEAIYIHDHILNSETNILFEPSSETHVGDALRHFSQTKRISNPSSPRYGLTLTKRKHHLYTSTQHLESFRRFPSGLMEAKQYLISLGRLII